MTDPERAAFVERFYRAVDRQLSSLNLGIVLRYILDPLLLNGDVVRNAAELAAQAVERAVDEDRKALLEAATDQELVDLQSWCLEPIPWAAAMGEGGKT